MNVYSYGSAMPLLNIDWSWLKTILGVTSASSWFRPGVRGTAIGKTTITATVSISSKIEGREQYQVDRDKTITISTSSLWWTGWRFST